MPTSPANFDPGTLANKASVAFDAAFLTEANSELSQACGHALLFFQALSIVLIVAAMIWRLQDEKTQLHGVAATLIQVAFIATVPFWQGVILDTAQAVGAGIGYQPVASGGQPSPIMSDLWSLLRQWTPSGSPYLDALDAQSPVPPASGEEEAWALRAWNWARGVGAADASLFHGLWQAGSGSLRALLVFGTGAVSVTLISGVIVLTYLGEVLRYVVFFGGCALAPLFIAGLGLASWRSFSLRSLIGTAAVGFWPVGWALANLVTHTLLQRTLAWMVATSSGALAVPETTAPPLAVAAPYLAWGTLFTLFGVTVALCGWMLGTVYYVPVLMTRAVSATSAVLVGANSRDPHMTQTPEVGVTARVDTVAPGTTKVASTRPLPVLIVPAERGARGTGRLPAPHRSPVPTARARRGALG